MLFDLSRLQKITNPLYYPTFGTRFYEELYFGGAGSGKSVNIARKFVYRIITEQYHKFLFTRKVGRTLQESVFLEATNACRSFGMIENFHFFVNKTEKRITFPHLNSEILCVGLDNVAKLKSITGVTGIWIEEITELLYRDYLQLKGRMRGIQKNFKQIIMSCNPININHWVKQKLIDKRSTKSHGRFEVGDGWMVLHSTYLDNYFLDEQDRKTYEGYKDEDEYFYKVYTLGEWGALGNLIYSKWKRFKDDKDLDWYDWVGYGQDFGYNHPNAIIKIGMQDDNIYVIDEMYLTKHTNNEIIKRAPEIIHDKMSELTSDSNQPGFIREWAEAGYNVWGAHKPAGSVAEGLSWIKSKKVFVHERCVNTWNEYQGYKYKEKSDGEILEEPVKLKDDAMDALRYGLDPIRLQVNCGAVA